MYGVNYNGLRKRDTYDEIVKYIESDPTKIRYPNRQATFLEQSHYMKHLGGEDYIQMEEQQLRASKEKVKEDIIRERAGGEETSSLVREELRREARTPLRTSSTQTARRFELTSSTQTETPPQRNEATSSTQTDAAPLRRSTAPRRSEASSSSTQTEAPQQRVAFAQTETIAPSVAESVMNVVESAQDKGTQRRLRNQRMAIEELGNTTRIPEAAMRAALEAQPQPKPAESKPRSSSPMIQYVGDEVMAEPAPEVDVQYSKAEMRRMRRKQAFPQPYGAPKALNPMSASSADASGSSAALEYQRRLREEELLRLEHQRLVSQPKRGRTKTVMMETEAEKAKKRSTSDNTSHKGKRSKVGGLLEIEPMPMTKAQKQEAKKRQQEENKAEKKDEKKAKKESKTEYFSIADAEPPKQRKKKEEPKKEKEKQGEEPKQEETNARVNRPQHKTHLDNNTSKKYWREQPLGYILDQLSLHGVRLDASLFSGNKTEHDPVLDRKVIKKVKKITKNDVLKMLYEKLKI